MTTSDPKKTWLIFSDLDGTLLDHHDYSFDAANEALAQVRELGLPLILASSKTRSEMDQIRRQLQLEDPFICENGAAICTPTLCATTGRSVSVEALAPGRSEVLARLEGLRKTEGYQFTGFNDASIDDIVAMTGLSQQAAAMAADRQFSEPLLWQDTAERLERFKQQLAASSLQAVQGGRFLSVAGPSDKAAAMQRLRERYGGVAQTFAVALGNSPNDESMLSAADVAVVVASQPPTPLQLPDSIRVINTTGVGPTGWQQAMSVLLQEYHVVNGDT